MRSKKQEIEVRGWEEACNLLFMDWTISFWNNECLPSCLNVGFRGSRSAFCNGLTWHVSILLIWKKVARLVFFCKVAIHKTPRFSSNKSLVFENAMFSVCFTLNLFYNPRKSPLTSYNHLFIASCTSLYSDAVSGNWKIKRRNKTFIQAHWKADRKSVV